MNDAQFLRTLRDFLQRHELIPPQGAVLLAVSGGIDSMMLLEGMAALREELGIARMAAMYVDHGLRPHETPQEAQAVLERAAHWGIEGKVCSIEIQSTEGSLQDAARQARREVLEALAVREQWDVIATGHHRDDQAETLLLRILRGTGPDGLSGIAPRSGRWIHPLLCFSREQLQQVALSEGIRWLEDSSNPSTKYRRNQLRHELIPALEQTYNPQIKPQLAQLADQMRADEEFIYAQLECKLQPPLLTATSTGLQIDLDHWETLPFALQWRCIREVAQRVCGHRLTWVHIEHILQLTQDRTGEKRASLPNDLHVMRQYKTLCFSPNTAHSSLVFGSSNEPFAIEIDQPQAVTCPTGMLSITSVSPSSPLQLLSPWEAYLPLSLTPPFPWSLRNRRPKDQLALQIGHRPLKKWMIDAKIPQSRRQHIALLECEHQICWVIGYRLLPPLQTSRPLEGWYLRFSPHDDAVTNDLF